MRAVIAILVLAGSAWAETPPTPDCSYPMKDGLGLDNESFDDPETRTGWRKLADIPGCEAAAADLIKQYRDSKTARQMRSLLHHEAQLRASVGDYPAAIDLIEEIQKTEPELSNRIYHEAEIAFYQKDRVALQAARDRLAALPKPDGFDEGAARFRERFPNYPPPTWPANLDTVDGFLNCLGTPYADAYAFSCRP